VHMSEEDYQSAKEYMIKLETSLKANIFSDLTKLNVTEYLAETRSILYPFIPLNTAYDVNVKIGEQVLFPTTKISNKDTNTLQINDTYYKLLSDHTLPTPTNNILLMNLLIGDPVGNEKQIGTPFVVSTVMKFHDPFKKSASVERDYMYVSDQATPFILKFTPALAIKKRGLQIMFEAVKSGQKSCEMTLNIFLMHQDKVKVSRQVTQLISFIKGANLTLQEDSEILWPMLYNCLPLYPSEESLKNTYRHRTLSAEQATTFLPVFTDFKGYSKEGNNIYFTRRAQHFFFDPTTGMNRNGAILGSSGGGKSVSTNYLVMNEWLAGSMQRIIDEGGSYKKLCSLLGGQYIDFTVNSNICLNPFTHIRDIDEELNQLVLLVEKMAAPKESFRDLETALVTEAIRSVWDKKTNLMTITDLAEMLRQHDKIEAREIATKLYTYTKDGQYGKWFQGANNLNFDSNLVVLELFGLKQQPALKSVVLMLLLTRIQHDMYNQTHIARKFAWFDEAKSYLGDPVTAEFIDDFYARLRKFNAGVWLITQSLSTIAMNPAIRSILNNCYWKIYLPHKEAEITEMMQKGIIPSDQSFAAMLRTVHKRDGEYGEFMLSNDDSFTTARLVLTRFQQILFFSSGNERNYINYLLDNGMNIVDAIRQLMEMESQGDLIPQFKEEAEESETIEVA
jgi:conjugal transfer ATP-binding protein TraC